MRGLLKVLKLDKPPTEQGALKILETVPDFDLLFQSGKVSQCTRNENKKLCK